GILLIVKTSMISHNRDSRLNFPNPKLNYIEICFVRTEFELNVEALQTLILSLLDLMQVSELVLNPKFTVKTSLGDERNGVTRILGGRKGFANWLKSNVLEALNIDIFKTSIIKLI
ncbi:hypothetical protein U1Q18_000402, partial [Sarracenia purpurea var. burkii]